MLRTVSTADWIAIASAVVATAVAIATDSVPGLILGLAVVACQWAMLRRLILGAINLGRAMERDAQNHRRIHGYQLLREIRRD